MAFEAGREVILTPESLLANLGVDRDILETIREEVEAVGAKCARS